MVSAQHLNFERIVHEESFNRAARALGVSQAAISGRIPALAAETGGPLWSPRCSKSGSWRIRALEAGMGGPLFTRGGHSAGRRRAALTEWGVAFLRYARRA